MLIILLIIIGILFLLWIFREALFSFFGAIFGCLFKIIKVAVIIIIIVAVIRIILFFIGI